MFPPRPTALAQTLLRDVIREGDTVIDATAGNGHDTVFLAACVGASGRVFAFDIQASALRSARARVEDAGLSAQVEFHLTSHVGMADFAGTSTVSAIMFNLGYLPGDDHDLTTVSSETITALEVATTLLRSGGVLSVVCYPGHPAGVEEAREVEVWMSSLTDLGWRVAKYGMPGTKRPAPFLVAGRKP